jgi:hypothetical protein
MSVRVWQVRFPGLLVAVSVERPSCRRKGRSSVDIPANIGQGHGQLALRPPSATGMAPSLIKLQM